MTVTYDELLAAFRWRNGDDTGHSSVMLLNAAMGERLDDDIFHETSFPHDPGDFARCLRLIEQLPWVERGLPVVAARYPQWFALVERWVEIAESYRGEVATGNCPRTMALMQSIRAGVDRQGAAL